VVALRLRLDLADRELTFFCSNDWPTASTFDAGDGVGVAVGVGGGVGVWLIASQPARNSSVTFPVIPGQGLTIK
jgi:hypothetical protein